MLELNKHKLYNHLSFSHHFFVVVSSVMKYVVANEVNNDLKKIKEN